MLVFGSFACFVIKYCTNKIQCTHPRLPRPRVLDIAEVWHIASQVTYVTMVPRVGNETLRPLGATMGNASSVTRA